MDALRLERQCQLTLRSMDEATGVGIIGDSQKADAGHGLTGLNSINSVVSSGKFEGLNGSYGAARPFGL